MTDATRNLSTAMLQAVRNRNLAGFRAAIEQGFDVRSSVRSENGSNSMPFVEKVARSRFSNALRLLIVDAQPCQISREDAVRAFHASLKSEASRTTITVFVDASILGTLPVLSLADSYRYAVYHSTTQARRVVETPEFNVNCCIQMCAGYWERPLHSAIKRNQYETLTRLLQLGAEVDATNCYGITALMMACGKVSFDSVRLLLSHGADPNSADGIRTNTWPLKLDAGDERIPSFPTFQSTPKKYRQRMEADKIIALLICAGLRPTAGSWFQRTSVVVHMSRDAGQTLQTLVHRLPTLAEAAIIQGRQAIRMVMNGKGGAGFNQVVNDLDIRNMMKEQLKINLIN